MTEDFISSPIFNLNSALIQTFIPKALSLEVVCLGLGHFQSQLKPFVQFLFFKEGIVQKLKEKNVTLKVTVYDPVFSESEIKEIKG